MMGRLIGRLRQASRSVLRPAGFAITATATLALGLGLATAVFTVANTLLVRRLPVADQGRLVVLWGETRNGAFTNFPLGVEETREVGRRSQALERIGFFAFYGAAPKPVRDGDRLFRLRRALVSGSFFEVLGAEPLLGRGLRPEDDLAGATPVLILSHKAWLETFGGDPSVIGRPLVMHETNQSYRIVGVMPRGLDYPRGTDFWAPLVAVSSGSSADSLHLTGPMVDLIARLRPGAAATDAETELTAFFGRPEAPSWARDVRAVAHPLTDLVLGDAKPAAIALSVAAGLLLLLTCINVANLLLVRGLTKAREIAVRTALGASRSRVIGELLLQSSLLAAVGALAGIGLAAAGIRGFVLLAPPEIPRLDEITVDWNVILVASVLTTAAMLIFGLAPAVVLSRAEIRDVLGSGSRGASGDRRSRWARESLVVVQVALAVVILSSAGLLIRSLRNLETVDLSYDPIGMQVAELAFRLDRHDSPERQRETIERIGPRVAAISGVESVSPVLSLPFSGVGGIYGRLGKPGESEQQLALNPMVTMEVVAPNYFTTLGLRILRGRPFSDQDGAGAPQVIVVSEAAARHYWPGVDPIGKELASGIGSGRLTVVGLVPDVRYVDLRETRPTIYFPIRQSFFAVTPTTLLIRSRSPGLAGAALADPIRLALREEGSGVDLASITSFESLLARPMAQPRLNALLLSIFAAAAVSLAGVGLFGVIAATVRQRTRELGIRMALGASRTAVRQLLTARGLKIAAAGVLAGVVGSLAVTRLVSTLLFGVSPADPLTLGATVGLILMVSVTASLIPALAGSRIDPATTLRTEG